MPDVYKTIQGNLPAAQTSLYTAPAGNGVIIKHMIFNNYSAGTVSFSIWKGGTANANLIVNAISLLAGEAYEIDDTETLAAAAQLYGIAGGATSISYEISVDETS